MRPASVSSVPLPIPPVPSVSFIPLPIPPASSVSSVPQLIPPAPTTNPTSSTFHNSAYSLHVHGIDKEIKNLCSLHDYNHDQVLSDLRSCPH